MQILPRLEGGGVERGTLEVANYLTEQDHESMVVSQGGRLMNDLQTQGSQHITLRVGDKSPSTLLTVGKLSKLFDQFKPDIVHPRSRLPAWLTYLALKQVRSPSKPHFITSVHGLHSVSKYSSIIGRGELVEVVSDTAKRYLLENYPQANERSVRIIHRGIDPNDYNRSFRPSESWLAEFRSRVNLRHSKTVLLPGRVSRLKGHLFFLNSMEVYQRRWGKVNVLIVGDPEARGKQYLREIEQQVSKSEILAQSVIFLPHRTDLREIMSISDLVVNFSMKPESFGRVVLEALSLGTPVVGFNHGGVGEILSRLYPRGLVDPQDVNNAVETINTVLEGTFQIENHSFTLNEMCRKTLRMYEEVVQ